MPFSDAQITTSFNWAVPTAGWTDIPGLTLSFTVSQPAFVIAILSISFFNTTNAAKTVFGRIVVDGAELQLNQRATTIVASGYEDLTVIDLEDVAPGKHVVKAQVQALATGAIINGQSARLSILVFHRGDAGPADASLAVLG